MKNKLRFLMADDDNEDVFLVRELLKEGLIEYEVELDWAKNREALLKTLSDHSYDLFLLDFRLGASNGLELLKSLRSRVGDIPIIMLTGKGDQKIAVEAMKLGAADFVDKSQLEAGTFGHAIRRALNVYREAAQRKQMEQALADQNTVVHGLSEAVSCLLTHNEPEITIGRSLAIMGTAVEMDWVGLFLHSSFSSEKGRDWQLSQQWAAHPDSHNKDTITALAGSVIKGPEFQKLIRELQQHHEILQPDMPGFMGFRSCFLVPIRVQDTFLGFLTFARSSDDGNGSFARKSILSTFAAGLGWELKRAREEHAFRTLVQGTSGQTGDGFFDALVRHLPQALGFRCAFVCEVVEYGKTLARVLKGWDGFLLNPGEPFDLMDSPAEETLGGMYSFYADRVRELFPHDPQLAQLKVNSFAAAPFFESTGKVSGYLAVLDDCPMTDREGVLSILRLFASRAGAELERKRTEERIREMAYHDSLTGLPNRVLLNDRLNLTLRQAQRNKEMVAILFLDFDNFKEINDTYGHPIGDQLLIEGARRLTECLREGDTVARLGGDEFVLMLPGIHQTGDVARVALKINSVIKTPFIVEGEEVRISVSIGIALYPMDGEDNKMLLKKADDALLGAKKKGRDSFHFASPVVPAREESR